LEFVQTISKDGYGAYIEIGKSSGTLETTDVTAINFFKENAITKISVEGDGCSFAFSFDGRTTYKTLAGGSWVDCDPAEIITKGIKAYDLSAITSAKWAEIFQKTNMDFLVGFDRSSPGVLPEKLLYSLTSYSTSSTYYVPEGFKISKITERKTSDDLPATFTYIRAYDVDGNLVLSSRAQNYRYETVTYIIPNNMDIRSIYQYTTAGRQQDVAYYGGNKENVLSSITVETPLNLPPVIADVSATPTTLHKGSVTISGTVTDVDEDTLQYRIKINNTIVVPWTAFLPQPLSLSEILSINDCPVGTNSITIDVFDGEKSATYSTYITRTNENPSVIGILNGLSLTATAGDDDSDNIKYRIILNGVVKQDWSGYMETPAAINYTIKQRDVLVGQQNSLVIEVTDELGGTGNCVFDFVGVENKKRYAILV
jgi:hypothetical protein